jgi:Na+-translocating ferredoxin:NAD+ oxidoreductase RnfE subunit
MFLAEVCWCLTSILCILTVLIVLDCIVCGEKKFAAQKKPPKRHKRRFAV